MSLVDETVCCQLRVDGIIAPLPFRRVLATDYYDGPVEGFTSCSICQRSYSFRLLARDCAQDTRTFGLSHLSVSLDEIATRLQLTSAVSTMVTLIPPLEASLDAYVSVLLTGEVELATVVLGGWPGRSSVWMNPHDPGFNRLIKDQSQ